MSNSGASAPITAEEKHGVTADIIKKYFKYEDGKLIRIFGGHNSRIGRWDWGTNNKGYMQVRIVRKMMKVHRLVWVLHYGFIPHGMQVDHINGNKSDNRIENLRIVTNLENNLNKSIHTSGFAGVYFHKAKNKWQVRMFIDGKTRHFGYYLNKEDAIKRRLEVEQNYGFNVCSRRIND